MSFFGRETRPPTPRDRGTAAQPEMSSPSPSSRAPRGTVIAAGLRIEGQVTGADRIQIDGTLQGEVRIDGAVVVGPEGHMVGRVEARHITVHGRVEGNVAASERAEVTASGRVDGDIEAPRVVIAEGAYFKGNVKMGQSTGGSSAPTGREPGGTGGAGPREGAP